MKYYFLFSVLTVFALSSCNKEEENKCSMAWASENKQVKLEYEEALKAYFDFQSVENCNNAKAAAQAYLDAIQPYGDCEEITGLSRGSWEAAMASAQTRIAQMSDCTPALCAANWVINTQYQLDDVEQKAADYADLGSYYTCRAYKDALEVYIDYLSYYENCPDLIGQLRTNWEYALYDAQAQLNNLAGGC